MRLLTTMQFSRFSGDSVPRGNYYIYHPAERTVNGSCRPHPRAPPWPPGPWQAKGWQREGPGGGGVYG